MRGAMAVMQGSVLAQGGQLPFVAIDSLAMSEEEASRAQADINAQRLIAETLAERR